MYFCTRLKAHSRRSGRVVECTGLENRRTCERTGGSNPSSSAKKACQLAGLFTSTLIMGCTGFDILLILFPLQWQPPPPH